MKALTAAPTLTEQVREAILAEIAAGRLQPGERVIQEQLAQALGVSRQPVQQALALLRNQGVLREAPGRGLEVTPLQPDEVQHVYDLRSALEALACRRAAERVAAGLERSALRQGQALVEAGRKAVASGVVGRMVAADQRFHQFVYALSGNPLLAPTMATHWTHMQRVMAEVLTRDETPRDIWDQHVAMLQAITDGQPAQAEALARAHTDQAAGFMLARLRALAAPGAPGASEATGSAAAGAPGPAAGAGAAAAAAAGRPGRGQS